MVKQWSYRTEWVWWNSEAIEQRVWWKSEAIEQRVWWNSEAIEQSEYGETVKL